MTVENPRLRLLLGTQWKLIVAVLVVVALASFGAAAASYGDQPTETVTQKTNEQTVRTASSHRATVVANDTLWRQGRVLRNKPVYLRNATPTLNVSATTSVEGADGARVRHVWQLVLAASTEDGTLYTERRELANVSRQSTTATSSVVLDVSAIDERLATIQQETEGVAAVTATLRLRVRYCTDPAGGCRYTGTNSYSTPLFVDDRSFRLGGDMGGSTAHSTEATTQVPQPRDWGSILGMALAGVVALALAGAVVAVDPRDIDVEAARHDLHRTQYEEWISPGVIPMGVSQQFVELETIEDVVDVAIDTNERVVYDRRRDLYAVISENVVYYFSTGGSWMESAFRPMAGNGEGGMAGEPGDGGPFGGGGMGGAPDGAFGFPDEGEGPFGGEEAPGAGDDPDDAEDRDSPFAGTGGGPRAGGGGEESPFGGNGEGGDSPFGGNGDGGDSPFGGDGGDDEDDDGPFGDGA